MRNFFKKTLLIYIISTILFSFIYTPHSDKPSPPVLIPVYRTETNTVSYIPAETYVSKVVASEMPSSFHMEALKAQSVVSRTYAFSKISSGSPAAHPQAPLCDTTHCQVYKDNFDQNTNWKKIKKAVFSTHNQLLYYDNKITAEPLYHASSGGHTENSEDVFVSAIPYLRSVESPYEKEVDRNGHGVGMSQHGANGMANAGYDYKKILSHYYSGTVVY